MRLILSIKFECFKLHKIANNKLFNDETLISIFLNVSAEEDREMDRVSFYYYFFLAAAAPPAVSPAPALNLK